MKKFIYQNDEGGITIITPTPEALSVYTVEQIADVETTFVLINKSLRIRKETQFAIHR